MSSVPKTAPHSPENPLVNGLAQVLKEVREAALEARACIAAAPDVIAQLEKKIATSAQAEAQLMAAIHAISPRDAAILEKAPVGEPLYGEERLLLSLRGSDLVSQITHEGGLLRPRSPAPPVARIGRPLTAQQLKELGSK